MSKRTEGSEKHQEHEQRKTASGEKKRKPRGALFRSGDPTLAKRLEDEVYNSRR